MNVKDLPAPDLEASRLHGESHPESTWVRTNLAEAMPGVLTPLSWSIWSQGLELSGRRIFSDLGALRRRDAGVPLALADRTVGAFYGRPAFRLEFWCEMGDRLPGTSGAAVAQQMASYVPPDLAARPRRTNYLPALAALIRGMAEAPRLVRRERDEVGRWYTESLQELAEPTEATAKRLLAEANLRFRQGIYRQGKTFFCGPQLVYDILTRLCASNSVAADSLMSGYGGHAETAIVTDLWACSRGRLDLSTFVERHGYHGPDEGQPHSRVWREDPAPLRELIERYARRPDSDAPDVQQGKLAVQRAAREQAFLRGLPATHRPAGRLALRLVTTYVPLRGVAKVIFLQCLDVVRAAARALGALWVASGIIDEVEDVFYLTAEEIDRGLPADVRAAIAARRAERDSYLPLELPAVFTGMPVPETQPAVTDELTGIGVSPGVVEAVARVVDDPAQTEFEDGEILVARTTDPSWASTMFLASGLIVDIGGPLSHAAVIARELGVPCVMNTGIATKVIKTGDLCRMDGATGSVTVLRSNPIDPNEH